MSIASRMHVAMCDVAAAAGLLTRLPIRVNTDEAINRGAAAAWAYPLVGALLGVLAAAAGLTAMAFGQSAGVSAGIALFTGILVSGALHEDGLADTADGFWGGWTTERRLEIMRDSRIGTYGVLALVFSVLFRWTLLTALISSGSLMGGLIAASVAAQTAMVAVWSTLPSARKTGLAASNGQPSQRTVIAACASAWILLICLVGIPATLGLTIALVGVVWVFHQLAMQKIGGHTGDVLGATQQLSLIVALCILAT